MKRRRQRHASFLRQLEGAVRSLRGIKPDGVYVFSVNAMHGHYQIMIGPKPTGASEKGRDGRPIEIDGEIHHLFVSPHAARLVPSRQQLRHNLHDTVIMRDLSVHLVDPDGGGLHLAKRGESNVHPRECINLAGEEGEQIIERSDRDRLLTMAAYRIAQHDILDALRHRPEDRSEEQSS